MGRTSLLRRLTADPHALDADSLKADCGKLATTAIADLQAGQRAVIAGRLRHVMYSPTEHVPTVSAELYDGSGSMQLIWLGRRRIAGIEPGRLVVAKGCVGRRADSGTDQLAIYNPWYALRCPSDD